MNIQRRKLWFQYLLQVNQFQKQEFKLVLMWYLYILLPIRTSLVSFRFTRNLFNTENERVVKSVYDPGFPGIVMNFITDDISTYTLVKKQYVNGGHITRMYTAKQETPSCSNTQRPIMKSGEVLTEGTRPSMNSDIPVTENKEK